MAICIYKIRSIIKPERIYIGSTIDSHTRWLAHLRCLRKNNHHSLKLQNHANKYGLDDLVFEIIEVVDNPGQLGQMEESYILTYKPFFNISTVSRCRRGAKSRPETVAKIAAANKGRKCSDEERAKMRERQLGRKLSEETKRKLSEANKGKPKSEETKKKMSIAQKNRPPEITEKSIAKLRGRKRPWMSERNKGNTYGRANKGKKRKPLSDEVKQKIREGNKGKVVGVETREKLRRINTGKKASSDAKKKMSEWHKRVKLKRDAKGRIVGVKADGED